MLWNIAHSYTKKKSVTVPAYQVGCKTDSSHILQLMTYKIVLNILPSRLTLYVLHMKLLVIISVDFHILHLKSFVEDLFCWLSDRYLCEPIKQVSTFAVPWAWSANRRWCSDYCFWASCPFCWLSKTNWWHRKTDVHFTYCGLIRQILASLLYVSKSRTLVCQHQN